MSFFPYVHPNYNFVVLKWLEMCVKGVVRPNKSIIHIQEFLWLFVSYISRVMISVGQFYLFFNNQQGLIFVKLFFLCHTWYQIIKFQFFWDHHVISICLFKQYTKLPISLVILRKYPPTMQKVNFEITNILYST